MDLEDIARFRRDSAWWFGADCSDSGAHVRPDRLRGAGFADGAACRRALLDAMLRVSADGAGGNHEESG